MAIIQKTSRDHLYVGWFCHTCICVHEVYVICNIMVSNWLKTVIFNNNKNLNRQLVITTYILIGTVKIHCRMFYKIDSCHIIYIIFKIYHSLGFSILLTPNIYSIYHVDKFYRNLFLILLWCNISLVFHTGYSFYNWMLYWSRKVSELKGLYNIFHIKHFWISLLLPPIIMY